jgi:pyruvate dehydrogenase E1 component alpha subunit
MTLNLYNVNKLFIGEIFMLVGICGRAGAGKDTIGDYLIQKYNFKKISLADPIKRLVKDVFVLDDHTVYDRVAREQELEKWQQRDPVERIKNYLRSRGIWNENLEQEMLDSCAAQIDAAMEIARNTTLATSDALFDHVYAEPPQRMQDQKSDWAKRLVRKTVFKIKQ